MGTCILKRLEDAQADNDPIFGVIDGAYTNHCGSTDSITRPFDGDQIAIFNRILRYSNQNPLDVSYVEMHGTGTQAGDATEMRSVLSSFVPGRERMPNHPLHVGSSKANIGHAESASGVSSLAKVMMMMKHNEIPPHCGIKTKINHNYPLDLNDRNVHIAFKPTPWRREDQSSGKRTAFLNNFSAAGGNTAVLLEDAPVAEVSQEHDPRSTHLMALSAKTANSLKANIQALIGYLTANPDVSLSQLSYTTTARRMQHNYRTIVSGSSVDSIQSSLQKKMEGHDGKSIPNATKIPNIAFAFTGQGSLYTGVGKQLFGSVDQFKANILRFDSIAQSQGFPSFLPIVDGSATNVDEVETVVAHLALTCVQIALARLWMSWGICPSAAIGHSLGEYAAMNVAGVLTAGDAIYLVGKRAQLLSERCTKGTHAMLAVKAPVDTVKPRISKSSSEVACMNQPSGTVISGPIEEIGHWQSELHSPSQNCVKLDIPYAFHSAQVDPILEDFEKAASGVRFSTPTIPFMSPLLGKVVTEAEDIGPSYVSRACREPVNFQGALQSALESNSVTEKTIWVEIGSHPACSGMIKGTLGSHVTALPSLRSGVDTWNVLTNGLETLYLNGIDIEWNEYHRQFKSAHKVLELPRYSWDLKNYWIMYKNDFCLTKGDALVAPETNTAAIEAKPAATRLSHSVQSIVEEKNQADIASLTIETDINDPQLAPVIQGHKVNGAALCPSVSQSPSLGSILLTPLVSIRRHGFDHGRPHAQSQWHGRRQYRSRCRHHGCRQAFDL